MKCVLVLVPVNEVRSTSQNDKGRKFATIHTGRFEVMASVEEDGLIRVDRETFDKSFVIEEDVEVVGSALD